MSNSQTATRLQTVAIPNKANAYLKLVEKDPGAKNAWRIKTAPDTFEGAEGE